MTEQATPRRPWWRLHLSTVALSLLAADALATLIVPADYAGGSGIAHHFAYGWPWQYAHAWSNDPEPTLPPIFGPLTDRAPWMLPRLWLVGKNATWYPWPLAADLGLGLAAVAVVAAVLEWRRRRRRSFWQFTTKDLIAVTLVAALVVGWFARAKHQRDAETASIERLVPWLREVPRGYPVAPQDASRNSRYQGPQWLRRLVPQDSCTWFERLYTLDLQPYRGEPRELLSAGSMTAFRHLIGLSIRGNVLKPADLSQVVRHTQAANLYLQSSALDERTSAALAAIPTLEGLFIADCAIDNRSILALARSPHLREVLIEGFQAGTQDPESRLKDELSHNPQPIHVEVGPDHIHFWHGDNRTHVPRAYASPPQP